LEPIVHASDRVPGAVIHVPHCSTVVPADVRGQFVIGDGELHGELLAMTDHLTDRLFAVPEELAFTVRYGVSRLVVDPERFRNDADERMAACGMGAVYTATSRGTPLRCRLTEWEREDLLRRFYDPHQARLTQAVSAALDAHGCCLIIDAHSFPSKPLPCRMRRYHVSQTWRSGWIRHWRPA
jgi:N-formylglutamate amidohydrolase